jgi:hypothetical protein
MKFTAKEAVGSVGHFATPAWIIRRWKDSITHPSESHVHGTIVIQLQRKHRRPADWRKADEMRPICFPAEMFRPGIKSWIEYRDCCARLWI